ncbi:MAG: beta-lactamase family protein [Ardenticatenaceae bacterium]|nr:beta-lactamase family protein [Ardenticatenaceae bacterium]MCB9442934.1 beta-lactamase family protein [Ardenticatenaceae bacterium]
MTKKGKKKWQQLGEFVTKSMQAKGIPGTAVGLWYKEQTWAAGFGVTNRDNPLPVTDKTLFQIGSISKTFTALAIMQLVEQGKIDLDTPIRTFLPDFQAQDETVAASVTTRHLLTHLSGWEGDLFHDTGWGEDGLARYMALIAEQEQVLPIDTAVSYNNAAFSLAGHLIERVSGQPYETVIQTQILEPLGMADAFFDARDVITHRFAVGHNDGQVARPWYLTRSAYPAGGLCCHVQDLLQYGRFHLGDSTKNDHPLISADTLALCHTPQHTIFGNEAIALAWFVDDRAGKRILKHGGGTKGQVTLLALVPEHNLILVVLTNSENGGSLTREVLEWVMVEYLDTPIPQPEPIAYETADLQPYVGVYDRSFANVELGIIGGRLIGQLAYKKGFPDEKTPPPPPPPPATLMPVGQDHFIITDGPMTKSEAHFLRRPDNSIGWLRLGLRAYRRVA